MPEDLDFVDVFYAGDNLRGVPAFRVPRLSAREQVEIFEARWCNRAQGIVMKYKSGEMHCPSESLRMGHSLIFSNACNPSRYRRLLAAWKPRRTA